MEVTFQATSFQAAARPQVVNFLAQIGHFAGRFLAKFLALNILSFRIVYLWKCDFLSCKGRCDDELNRQWQWQSNEINNNLIKTLALNEFRL